MHGTRGAGVVISSQHFIISLGSAFEPAAAACRTSCVPWSGRISTPSSCRGTRIAVSHCVLCRPSDPVQALGGFKKVAKRLGMGYKNATSGSAASDAEEPNDTGRGHADASIPGPQPTSHIREVPGTPLFWRNGELMAASEEGLFSLQDSWHAAARREDAVRRVIRTRELVR